MDTAVIQRQLLHMPNICCVVGDIGIHGLQACQIERGGGQDLWRSLVGHSLSGYRRQGLRRPDNRQPNDRPQVLEIKYFGLHLSRQQRWDAGGVKS